MIETAIILSLQIFAIRILFLEGMIFGWIRIIVANLLDWLCGLKWSQYIQKPIWSCFPCMASIWTILLSWSFDLRMILMVCSINFIIDLIIPPYDEKFLTR
jgi:hypothetical protein